jgi:hypothetical protein
MSYGFSGAIDERETLAFVKKFAPLIPTLLKRLIVRFTAPTTAADRDCFTAGPLTPADRRNMPGLVSNPPPPQTYFQNKNRVKKCKLQEHNDDAHLFGGAVFVIIKAPIDISAPRLYVPLYRMNVYLGRGSAIRTKILITVPGKHVNKQTTIAPMLFGLIATNY